MLISNTIQMMKYSIFIPLLFLTASLFAQQTTDEAAITQPIKNFFEGMLQKDTALIQSTLYSETRLATTGTDKAGQSFFKAQSMEKFIQAIGNMPADRILNEKILSYDVSVDDHLAIVWTPYEFYLGDQFSHCGVNVFELFHTSAGWKITSIVDTRRTEGCK